MERISIAAAQSTSIKGEIQKNINHHIQFIELAVSQKVDLIVFPELSLTGYEPQVAKDCAITPDDSRLNPFIDLSCEYQIAIVVGSPVMNDNGKPFIGAIAFEPETSPCVYRKQFLHGGEEKYFSTGNQDVMLTLGNEKIGLAVCADINHPEHAGKAAADGASIYTAGVLISETGYNSDTQFLQQYAGQHTMAVLMANHGGPTGGWISAGKSAIWDDKGNVIIKAESVGNQLVIAVKEKNAWTGDCISIPQVPQNL